MRNLTIEEMLINECAITDFIVDFISGRKNGFVDDYKLNKNNDGSMDWLTKPTLFGCKEDINGFSLIFENLYDFLEAKKAIGIYENVIDEDIEFPILYVSKPNDSYVVDNSKNIWLSDNNKKWLNRAWSWKEYKIKNFCCKHRPYFDGASFGDEVFDILIGRRGTITKTKGHSQYMITVDFGECCRTYSKYGYYSISHSMQTLFYIKDINNLELVSNGFDYNIEVKND